MGSFTIGKPRPRTMGLGVALTDYAAECVLKLLAQEGKDPSSFALRVSVLGGGCSGYRYDIRWDQPAEGDILVTHPSGARLILDTHSAELLDGAKVEYFSRLQGAGFAVVNPNATGTCGCGESFSM